MGRKKKRVVISLVINKDFFEIYFMHTLACSGIANVKFIYNRSWNKSGTISSNRSLLETQARIDVAIE